MSAEWQIDWKFLRKRAQSIEMIAKHNSRKKKSIIFLFLNSSNPLDQVSTNYEKKLVILYHKSLNIHEFDPLALFYAIQRVFVNKKS